MILPLYIIILEIYLFTTECFKALNNSLTYVFDTTISGTASAKSCSEYNCNLNEVLQPLIHLMFRPSMEISDFTFLISSIEFLIQQNFQMFLLFVLYS